MRAVSTLLCEAATTSDGLINIIRGGIVVVEAPSFPIALFRLTLAVTLEAEPAEVPGPHVLTVRFTKPPSGEEASRVTVTYHAQPTVGETRRTVGNLVVPLDRVIIEEPGSYDVAIELDGQPLQTIPLDALVVATATTDTLSQPPAP